MPTNNQKVQIDVNAVFEDVLTLERADQKRLLKGLKKIEKLTWHELYRDGGLQWEQIRSKQGPNGEVLYSLRLSQRFRAVAIREGSWLRLVAVCPDHDS